MPGHVHVHSDSAQAPGGLGDWVLEKEECNRSREESQATLRRRGRLWELNLRAQVYNCSVFRLQNGNSG